MTDDRRDAVTEALSPETKAALEALGALPQFGGQLRVTLPAPDSCVCGHIQTHHRLSIRGEFNFSHECQWIGCGCPRWVQR